MSKADKHDEKKPKHQGDHHDEANPMPDTHHVNPESDDSPQKPDKGKK